jgi:hypothetical protein
MLILKFNHLSHIERGVFHHIEVSGAQKFFGFSLTDGFECFLCVNFTNRLSMLGLEKHSVTDLLINRWIVN